MNLYKILGTRKNAKPETIKKAFRKKARETHPDHGGDPEEFKKVQEAWRILRDPKWRAFYDEHGFPPPEAKTGAANPETQEENAVTSIILEAWDKTGETVMGGMGFGSKFEKDLKRELLSLIQKGINQDKRLLEKFRKLLKDYRKVEARIVSGEYIQARMAQQILLLEENIDRGEKAAQAKEKAFKWVQENFEYAFDDRRKPAGMLHYTLGIDCSTGWSSFK